MNDLRKYHYAHRLNKNGTYDSICLRCMGTAVFSMPEADLKYHEDRHVCDGVMLYWINQVLQKYQPPAPETVLYPSVECRAYRGGFETSFALL